MPKQKAKKPKTEEKNKQGRPTKLTVWIEYMEKIVNEGMNAIIFTDKDLVELTNEAIDDDDSLTEEEKKKYKVDEVRFKKWKMGQLKDVDTLERFRTVYKKALKRQRKYLFARFQSQDEKAWQRWAWIIERKFDEWNLRNIGVHKIDQNIKVGPALDLTKLSDKELEQYEKLTNKATNSLGEDEEKLLPIPS